MPVMPTARIQGLEAGSMIACPVAPIGLESRFQVVRRFGAAFADQERVALQVPHGLRRAKLPSCQTTPGTNKALVTYLPTDTVAPAGVYDSFDRCHLLASGIRCIQPGLST